MPKNAAIRLQQDISQRLADLRSLLRRQQLDGVLVPREDEYLGHFIALPASAERLKWISGFSGSAGTAVILPTRAALFVDGRYVLRARLEVPPTEFEIFQTPGATPEEWAAKHLSRGARLGLDPQLHTAAEVQRLRLRLSEKNIKLRLLRRNIIDRLWKKDRPAVPAGRIRIHPTRLAGLSPMKKLTAVQTCLRQARDDASILTLPDSVSWLFNLRASDIDFAPVVLAFAIAYADRKADLFLDKARIDSILAEHLSDVANVVEPDRLPEVIHDLGKQKLRVRIERATASAWFAEKLERSGATLHDAPDPCRILKARKNPVEVRGAKSAHLRDGKAVIRLLAWLEAIARIEELSELSIVEKLDEFRKADGSYRGNPFPTICGAGSNGAIIHYRVSEASSKRLALGQLLLLDSGGQYLDGTTDVTRTIAIGKPTMEMQECFTLVLKGHIAIATARFPVGTRGVDLDPFARRMLWQAGHDFDHGTGHGVGSYLSVHEGPQTISRMGMTALEPGMIVSNEPGYYKEGHYGIRIENLVLVIGPAEIPGGERAMMSFETLTQVPFDRRLIVPKMLSPQESDWLNIYHHRVREAMAPDLQPAERAWLIKATEPI